MNCSHFFVLDRVFSLQTPPSILMNAMTAEVIEPFVLWMKNRNLTLGLGDPLPPVVRSFLPLSVEHIAEIIAPLLTTTGQTIIRGIALSGKVTTDWKEPLDLIEFEKRSIAKKYGIYCWRYKGVVVYVGQSTEEWYILERDIEAYRRILDKYYGEGKGLEFFLEKIDESKGELKANAEGVIEGIKWDRRYYFKGITSRFLQDISVAARASDGSKSAIDQFISEVFAYGQPEKLEFCQLMSFDGVPERYWDTYRGLLSIMETVFAVRCGSLDMTNPGNDQDGRRIKDWIKWDKKSG